MSEEDEVLKVIRQGAVTRLVLNRPHALNAITLELSEALRKAAREAAADPKVRVVVLSGEGRAFVAGGDLKTFAKENGPIDRPLIGRIIASFHEAVETLATMPKPVVAQIHGAVAGGGVSLALAADLAICSQDARFVLAYSALGAPTDGGASWSLPRMIGMRRALELALLNRPVGADEALAIGLVNKVVAPEALEGEVEAIAANLAAGPTIAYASLKRLIRGAFDETLASQLDKEARAYLHCAGTADFAEGVAAFLEKRKARYTGE